MMRDTLLLSLAPMAEKIGVPVNWLRAEAEAGRVPSIMVHNRRMFIASTVESALAKLAAEQPDDRKLVANG